mmetsp:Transcript_3698/g.5574  ORF Transcript_3698/g.5574 Transcript_3698/m.5574 type:complete len:442 (-) Transcript_3698:16-1341(-)
MLWNMYALDFKDKALIAKLSEPLVSSHTQLSDDDLVSLFKSFAHFGSIPEDVRASLIKMTIRKSQDLDFATLGDICQSLSMIETETNGTLMNIIKQKISGYMHRDELEHLIYRPKVLQQDPDVLHLENPGQEKQVAKFLERKDFLRIVKGANYILPRQVEQFMRAFSSFSVFDLDMLSTLEICLIEQIEMANGQQLASIFQSHVLWTFNVVVNTSKSQKPRLRKYYKKYNEEFQENLLRAMLRCVDTEMNAKAILSVLVNMQIAHIKKRVNIKVALKLAMKGVSNLRTEMESIISVQGEKRFEEFESLLVKYFELSTRLCLKPRNREQLIKAIDQEFVDYNRFKTGDVDAPDFSIMELSQAVCPLGFVFKDGLAMRAKLRGLKEQFEENQALRDALEAENKQGLEELEEDFEESEEEETESKIAEENIAEEPATEQGESEK